MTQTPARIHPRSVLLPLGLGTALSLMGDSALYVVLPTQTAAAGITLASVGILLSANRAIRLFLNGPAGVLYDRLPKRGLFVGSLFLGALSTALYAATTGFWPLLLGRLLWGLAWSGIWVGGAAIILDVTLDDNRGRWTGLYQTWFFAGAALGAFSGGLFTDRFGYHNAMWIAAGVTAAGGLFAAFRLPETRGVQHMNPDGRLPGGWRTLIGNTRLLAAVALQGINRFVIAGVLVATLALLVEDNLADPSPALGVATLTGALAAGRTLLSIFSAPLAGSLSDRLGSRWTITLAAAGVGVVGMLLVSLRQPLWILVGILLGAVSGGGLQSLVTALTGDLVSPHQRGQAIGLLHTVGDFGSAAGPILAYLLLPWVGLRGLYLLCAALLLAGSLLALRILLRERRETALHTGP